MIYVVVLSRGRQPESIIAHRLPRAEPKGALKAESITPRGLSCKLSALSVPKAISKDLGLCHRREDAMPLAKHVVILLSCDFVIERHNRKSC